MEVTSMAKCSISVQNPMKNTFCTEIEHLAIEVTSISYEVNNKNNHNNENNQSKTNNYNLTITLVIIKVDILVSRRQIPTSPCTIQTGFRSFQVTFLC